MSVTSLQSLLTAQVLQSQAEQGNVNEALVGTVTDNQDPEKLGRVKVAFPALSVDLASRWIPVISTGAGKNRGWFFQPEVHDEVLVLFEHGSMERPYVLGALWNGKDKPPDNNADGKNARRVIKSRAGSRLMFFDDDGGQDKIVIEDGAGKGRITFDAAANHITIEALAGDVCVQAPTGEIKFVSKTATWTAQTELSLQAGSTVDVGARSATFSGKSLIQISGGPTSNVNSGGGSPAQAQTSPADVPDKYGS